MTEKHHMDQNSYISTLYPKPGVVSDNITQGDDVPKSPGQPTQGGTDRPHALAGRPRFGANEIMLLTRVMLSR
jgi:hypothetical protein